MKQSFHEDFQDYGQGPKHNQMLSIRRKSSQLTEGYHICTMTYSQARFFYVYIKELVKHFQILHSIIVYLLLVQQPLSEVVQQGMKWIQQNQKMYRIIQVLAYIANFSTILFISLLYSKASHQNKTKLVQTIIRNLPLWAEIHFFVASYLMFLSVVENFLLFMASIFIYFYYNIMLANDTNRRGPAFITSSASNICFCGIFVLVYTANCVCLALSSPILHEICLLVGTLAYLICYQSFGYKIFLNPHIQRSLGILVALNCVLMVQIIEAKWTGSNFLAKSNIFGVFLTSMITIVTIIRYTDSRLERSYHFIESTINNSQKLKYFELFLWSYQKERTGSIEAKSYLKGMVKEISGDKHYIENQYSFYSTKKSLYGNNDGQKDVIVPTFDQILRNYFQIQYQNMLKRDQSAETIISYIQFMLNTSGSFYRIHLLLQRAKRFKLGFLDKLKMTKISLILKENIQKFNKGVYSSIDIDQIMHSEDIFHEILEDISVVIQKNIDNWAQVRFKTINQTIIEDNLKKIHNVIDNIDRKWLSLTHLLKSNKKWSFMHLIYRLYIKNQRIKSQVLAEIEEDDSFNQRTQIGVDKIFNINTFYLRCIMTLRELRILKTSSNFIKLTCYSQDQVLGSQLNMILPQQVRMNHDQKVMSWLQKGECNQEKNYRTIYSYFMNKHMLKIPAKIIFTLHIDYISQYNFQFVALLNVKTNASVSMDEKHQSQNTKDVLLMIDNKCQTVLDNKNNIFLKQKHLIPVKDHPEVSYIKLMLIIMVLGTLSVNIVYAIQTYTDLTSLQDNIISYFNFLYIYRYSMSIGKNYMKSFLNLGDQTKVNNQIDFAFRQINALSQDPFTIQTIFDTNVNKPAIYYPYMNNSFNKGLGLNQIDIFYAILQNLAALSKSSSHINRSGFEFNQFNMYIKPGYNAMLNGTKYRLNEKLGETLQRISNSQYIYAGIHTFIALLMLAIIIVSIYRFLQHMKEVMKIIFHFEQDTIKAIARYWQQFEVFFGAIKVQSESYERTIMKARKAAFIQQKREQFTNSNLNRHQKEVKLSKNYRKGLFITFSILLILIMGVFFVNLTTQIYSIRKFGVLKVFYDAGFYFLRFYPVTSTLGHATLQKYYSVLYPNQSTYSPQRFKDTIDALFIMGNTDYIGNIQEQESPYYQKQKNYLFSNPCQFDPSILIDAEVTKAECVTYNNKSFTNGIISYIRNIQTPISDYLYGRTNMSYSHLDELTASLSLVTYYITDIIKVWSKEFVDRISFLKSNIMIVVSIASAINISLYIIIWILVKKILESSYRGVVYMLSYMMPESILLKQKITRQKLVGLKILDD